MAHIAKSLVEKEGYTQVMASSTSFGKDVIPRLGGLIDVQAITDVVKIEEGGSKFMRPIYAGTVMCTVSTSDATKLLTVRSANFDKVKPAEADNGAETAEVDSVGAIVEAQQG